jgi:hypothetical protein
MIRSLRLAAPALLLSVAACENDLLPPEETACESPAPLEGAPDPRAPGFVVVFRDGTPVEAAVARLTGHYAFRTKHVYTSALLGFAADLTPVQLAGVRCEPEVKYVAYDGVAHIGGR